MIKDVFIPQKIGNYYLFGKRIAGINIGKTAISGAIVLHKGSLSIIEKTVEIPLEGALGTDVQERIVEGLKQLTPSLANVDAIHSCLPGSSIVYKELQLPFTTYEKIALVVPFEVEPLLPFPLTDAVIDFIVTGTDSEQNRSQVLVAAVQKQHIINHLELYAQAGISPDKISISLFELYGLYTATVHNTLVASVALITIGLEEVQIVYIVGGRLRFVRTISKGMLLVAKKVADTLAITPSQALEHIIRFGFTNTEWPEYVKAVSQGFTDLWELIQFTLTSFAVHTPGNNPVEKIVLFGGTTITKGLPEFITEKSTIPCELFAANALLSIPGTSIKNGVSLPDSTIISIATALALPTLDLFNLRKGDFSTKNYTLLYKQYITLSVLAVLLPLALYTYSHLEIRALEKEVNASEQEAIGAITHRFRTLDAQEGTTLEELLDGAQEILKRESMTWGVFSNQSRSAFLHYLLELTNLLDKDALGLTLEKITCTENTIILKGRVRDYAALTVLERELRQSKLFKVVEGSPTPEFEALKITVARNGGE